MIVKAFTSERAAGLPVTQRKFTPFMTIWDEMHRDVKREVVTPMVPLPLCQPDSTHATTPLAFAGATVVVPAYCSFKLEQAGAAQAAIPFFNSASVVARPRSPEGVPSLNVTGDSQCAEHDVVMHEYAETSSAAMAVKTAEAATMLATRDKQLIVRCPCA